MAEQSAPVSKQGFQSNYESKQPDAQGYVAYTDTENQVWRLLYERQITVLPEHACQEHIDGVERLQLTADCIPQLPEVNRILQPLTGWCVSPVKALISAKEFFTLLANRCFPAATFIRRMEELDYVKEPDIFHELFGHAPLLTQPVYADFMQSYGQQALAMDKTHWPLLLRLFWFTVEFGLIITAQGLRAYGGGILSSKEETIYSVESELPQRILFHPLLAFRTPYRIDMLQPVYYVINDYQQLFDCATFDLVRFMQQAHELGEFSPLFPVEPNNPNIRIFAC
ncbi:MAG: phenylalanine 4-monooxygenase [Legionellales bacterium]|nr:phenylalanine 4-monooxygenase [Legionellales bacterium]